MRAAATLRMGGCPAVCAALAILGCSARPNSPGPSWLDLQGGERSVEGELNGLSDRREYFFQGQAGQQVTIKVEAPGGIRLTVTAPSGSEEGAPGGLIANLFMNETGKYRVRLTESPMGKDWRGTYRMTIRVGKTP